MATTQSMIRRWNMWSVAGMNYVLCWLWEDVRAVLTVELDDVLGCERRPFGLAGVVFIGQRRFVLAWRCQHRGDQPAGACPSDHIEVVSDPSIRPVSLLQQQRPIQVNNECYKRMSDEPRMLTLLGYL